MGWKACLDKLTEKMATKTENQSQNIKKCKCI